MKVYTGLPHDIAKYIEMIVLRLLGVAAGCVIVILFFLQLEIRNRIGFSSKL